MRASRWPARRWIPALAVAALYALFAILYLGGDKDAYFALMRWLGGDATPNPFMDTHAILSALACHRQGFDVYVTHPCDALGRPHAYTPFWLFFAPLSDGTDATVPGLLLGLLFIAGLLALPPPRCRRDLVLLVLACTSSTVVYALERANNDIIVWLLVLLVIRLLRATRARRFAAYAVILFAGLLKLYPMILLGLAIWERPRRMMLIWIVGFLVAAAVIVPDLAAWRRTGAGTPMVMHGIDMFGATNFPYALAGGLARLGLVAPWIGPGLLGLCILYAGSLVMRLNSVLDLPRHVACLNQHERLLLLAGSLLIVGCFFTAANIFYRGIHFLFVLPVLFSLARQAEARTAVTCTAAAVAIVVVMWAEGLRYMLERAALWAGAGPLASRRADLLVWTVHELLLWWVVSVLGALTLAMAINTPAGRSFWARAGAYLPRAWRPQ